MLDISQKNIHSEIFSLIGWILVKKNKSCGIQSFDDDDLTAKSFVFKVNPLMNSGKIGDIFLHTK